MHTKTCLAHAVICAVENLRDSDRFDDALFASAIKMNTAADWARMYLESGTVTCLCASRKG